MALPKLNDAPKYELIIPSTKKKMRFRPFLVKEQKILLIAMESEDKSMIANSIADTISSCAQEDLDINSLTMFDIEYLFTQIRGKSVGESANILAKCSECEAENKLNVPLDKIKIEINDKNKSIEINSEYTLNMKYPKFTDAIKIASSDKSNIDQMYELIYACLDTLATQEELIDFKDEPKEEIETFLDGLTQEQFDGISEFVSNMPSLKHDVKFKCNECKESNTLTLNGIQDFF